MPFKSNAGFTLIEMMITVAIIGILAAIAYPSYQESVRKGRRADAQAALVGFSAAMERFFLQSNSYENAAGGAALPAPATFYPAQVPLEGGTATYTLRLTSLTATTYTLTAAPAGPQTEDRCGSLTLTQSGVQGRTTSVPIEDCWRR